MGNQSKKNITKRDHDKLVHRCYKQLHRINNLLELETLINNKESNDNKTKLLKRKAWLEGQIANVKGKLPATAQK